MPVVADYRQRRRPDPDALELIEVKAECVGHDRLDDVGVAAGEPRRVGTDTGWSRVSAGFDHVCAIRTDGTLWCFGDDIYGQLGSGLAYQSAPSDVALP